MNTKTYLERIADFLDKRISSRFDKNSPLERVAESLEKLVGIKEEDRGLLNDKSHLERIAIAVEAGAVGKGGYPEPTGSIDITANGTYNVKDKAEAIVDVGEGEYEEILLWEFTEGVDDFTHPDAQNATRIVRFSDLEYNVDDFDYFKFHPRLSEPEKIIIVSGVKSGNFTTHTFGLLDKSSDPSTVGNNSIRRISIHGTDYPGYPNSITAYAVLTNDGRVTSTNEIIPDKIWGLRKKS